ncbi:kinase-like protein [Xylaria arbuscula]|nr:kinase-like protein [Xylaria arbuscula]
MTQTNGIPPTSEDRPPCPSCTQNECQCPIEASRGRILRELLMVSKKDQLNTHRRFIPRQALCGVVTAQEVGRHLKLVLGDQPDLIESLTAEIAPDEESETHCCLNRKCTGKRILFASFLQIAKEDYMLGLCQTNVEYCDSRLNESAPSQLSDGQTLTNRELQMIAWVQSQIRYHLLVRLDPEVGTAFDFDDGACLPLSDPSPITPTAVEGDSQPQMNAKILTMHKITRITVEPGHHEFDSGSNDFVLKTFKNPSDDDETKSVNSDFDHELKINRQLEQHPRIVPLLTAFQFRDEYHLLFPFAPRRDLQSLWGAYPIGKPDWCTPRWVLTECIGIAEALEHIHTRRPPLLHADIKPPNILCFPPQGDDEGPKLKLSDFGISLTAETNPEFKVEGRPHTKTYRPPEFETEKTITLNYDVWSLGCVFLEFLTWAIEGLKATEDFETRREDEDDDPRACKAEGKTQEDKFFRKAVAKSPLFGAKGKRSLRIQFVWYQTKSILPDKNIQSLRAPFHVSRKFTVRCHVKEAVDNHISRLEGLPHCPPEYRAFLGIIKGRMLDVDHKSRATSSEVRDELQKIDIMDIN